MALVPDVDGCGVSNKMGGQTFHNKNKNVTQDQETDLQSESFLSD